MSLSHAQPASLHTSPRLAGGWGIAVLLAVMVAVTPFTRAAVQILGPGIGSMDRQQFTLIELLVIMLAFFNRSVAVPPLRQLPRPVLWLLAAWFVWAGLAVAFSPIPAISLTRQMEWTVHGLFGWALCAVFTTYPALKDAVPRWFVWGLLVYLMPIGLFLGSVSDPQHFPWLGAMVGFTNIRHFGHYAAIALVAAYLPLLQAGKGERPALATWLILTILWGVVFWSGGRGPLLALFGSLAILTLLGLVPLARRLWGVTAVTATAGALLSIPLTPPNGSFGFLHLAARSEISDDLNRYSSGRIDIWRNLVEVIRDHPLFGMGPDQYRIATPDPTSWYALHPHNGPLQAALDWGIPGALLFFAGMLAAMLVTGTRLRARFDAHRLLGLWLLLMLLIFSCVSGTLYYALPVATMVIALALMVAGTEPAPAAKTGRPWMAMGLTGAAAAIFLLSCGSLAALNAPGIPAIDSARARFLHAFPSAMLSAGGGDRVNAWITQWRAEGRTDGYDWLDWTAALGSTPWNSMALKGQFLIEDGHEAAGWDWLEKAAARQHPLWQPPEARLSGAQG